MSYSNGQYHHTEARLSWGLSEPKTAERLGCRAAECILMQYTGLKDRDEVEIYEGDIVRVNRNFTGVCEFDPNPFCGFGYWRQDGKRERWYACYEDHEVIGNIYENPELLTPTFSPRPKTVGDPKGSARAIVTRSSTSLHQHGGG